MPPPTDPWSTGSAPASSTPTAGSTGRHWRPGCSATPRTEALNAIIHPAIGVAMVEGKDAHAGTDRIVVMDIPLLKDVHRELLALDAVVVVDAPPEVALERLTSQRGMPEEDARARQASQPSRAERLDGADFVVDNSDGPELLEREVDRVWGELRRLPERPGAGTGAGASGS